LIEDTKEVRILRTYYRKKSVEELEELRIGFKEVAANRLALAVIEDVLFERGKIPLAEYYKI
jgi:hypothetical protein